MAINRIIGELTLFLTLVLISEVTRTVVKRRCPESQQLANSLLICSLVLGWYTTSITLVLFNKWMLSAWMGDGLQFPILYTMSHMFFKGVFAAAYLVLGRCQPLPMKQWKIVRLAAFIGVLVGLDVAASNLSFQFITVTFYVMVKASSLIWILLFGIAARLEPCSPQIIATILTISLGIFLSLYGEAEFNFTGFWLVMASEVFAAARWVGTQALMKEDDLDAVTAVLYMAPGSTLTLLPAVLARERSEIGQLFTNERLACEYALLVLVPSFLSFSLLIVEVQLVKETSSLTLSVFGNLKSIVTILFAVMVFKESASPLQWCGLVIAMCGICIYSYFKNAGQPERDDTEDVPKYEAIEPGQVKESEGRGTPRSLWPQAEPVVFEDLSTVSSFEVWPPLDVVVVPAGPGRWVVPNPDDPYHFQAAGYGPPLFYPGRRVLPDPLELSFEDCCCGGGGGLSAAFSKQPTPRSSFG